MPFTPIVFNTGAAPGLDGPTFNFLETQYSEATLSLQHDLLTAFVHNGLVPTKDGTTLNQLDVSSGTAYVAQADNTRRNRTFSTTSTFTTSVASTTYYLDLNPDGTWSWGTAHSAQANYLTICTVTTDASANIATVTDTRTLNPTLLTGINGTLALPLASGTSLTLSNHLTANDAAFTGVNSGIELGSTSSANTPYLDFHSSGNNINYDVRLIASGGSASAGAGTLNIQAGALQFNGATVPNSGGTLQTNLNADMVDGLHAAAFAQLAGATFTGNIGGPIGGGIPTTRNGAALSVPIYTGTTTPSSPPTGAIWIKS